VWVAALGALDESLINNNGDGGGVTLSDYALWKSSLGNTSGSGAASESVPEPSAVWLVLCGLCLGGFRLRLIQP